MTNEEIDIVLDKALKLYMKKENSKAEMELKKLENENIKFSKEHQRKLKKIFKEYKK